MARKVEEINQYIVTQLVSNFAAEGIVINPTTWSRRNLLRLICYTVAIAQSLLEQLMDVFMGEVEYYQARSAAASTLWLQDAMFKFQYSATVPQILQLTNVVLTSATGIPFSFLTITYPVVDNNLRIITACSVKSNLSGRVAIKVAKGNPLTALTVAEVNAAKSYIDIKGAAGITYAVSSANADKLYIAADIYYAGAYSAIIQTSVIDAIRAFLQRLSITDFDGSIKLSDLEGVIRTTPGVNDILFTNVYARKDAEAFGAGASLVIAQAVQTRLYNTDAGYIVEETTATKTFADSLTFIAQ